MLDINPPRSSHVVRLNQPYFRGEMHTLCQLAATPTPSMLRMLMTGDQLAVSADGSEVAMVQIIDALTERVHHTALCTDLKFLRAHSSRGLGARILEVGNDYVLVWGRTDREQTGVWRLSAGHAQFLYPVTSLVGKIGQGPSRMDLGESPLYPGQVCVLTSGGLWSVDWNAHVSGYAGGDLSVIETFEGRPYAYQLKDQEITLFQSLHNPRFKPLALVRWQGQLMVVQTSDRGSQITQIGSAGAAPPTIHLPVHGRIEKVWSSPRGESVAILVQPRPGSPRRRLYLNSGHLVCQGVFTLAQDQLTWSASGRSFAAVIQRERSDGCVTQRIVTPSEEKHLALGMTAKEILVADDGTIDGVILTDGPHDYPEVRRGQLTAVPLAWNIHHDPDGAGVWNTVHDDQILKWVDRTGIAARAA